jgi:hypothetical protein
MMVFSRTHSREFIKTNMLINSRQLELITSIDSLMTWLPKQLRERVELYGHAKIMMVMFNQILLLKVLDLLVS